jgi:Na+-translocating ferredoxin:NAD+ oxidoreductase RnfD subunit
MTTARTTKSARSTTKPWYDPVLRFARTPKGLLLGILPILIALTAPGAAGGAGRAWLAVGVAAASAAVVDMIAVAIRGRRLLLPDGALLTGLIIGMILDPSLPLWQIAAVSAGAILTKQLIRVRRGHVLNPAAAALVAAGLIGVKTQSWWGVSSAPWYVIVPVLIITGLFITDRVNRLPMVGAFLVTYYGIAILGVFGGLAGRLAESYQSPFVNAALFAALVMLTDPPTSPAKRTDQFRYGMVCAVAGIVFVVLARQLYFLPLGLLVGNLWLVFVRTQRRAAGATRQRTAQPE